MSARVSVFVLAALVSGGLAHRCNAQGGTLDLTAPANYANQAKPAYITKDNTPTGNRLTDAGATLGRVLFYDRRLSRDNTISCSSCHQQARAFSDSATASTGVAGTTGRHSMRLMNARFGTEAHFFWDERAATLENQTTQPVRDATEMGWSGTGANPAFAELLAKLAAIPEYRVLFTAAFGTSAIDETRIQFALAQFVRSIQSFDSKYDAGRALANDNQPFANFSASENAGKALFLAPPGVNGAGCAVCHRPPEFDIDPNSRNNGIITSIAGGTDLTNTRSPSLRDLVGPGGQSNGAFMHNASLATLAAVVNHYNAIPADNANLDPRLRGPGGQLNLSIQQRSDLEAFLRTLTGSALYTASKWSNPFGPAGELALIVLPTSAVNIRANLDGTVTLSCKGVAGLQYELQSSVDARNWTKIADVLPDAAGNLTKAVSAPSGTLFRFAYTTPDA